MTSHERGFTLAELVVVLLVVGVLGAIGAARLGGNGMAGAAFAEQARATLRFAQKLAVGQNRPVYVQFGASTIALCFGSAAPCPAALRVPAIGGANGGAPACAPLAWYCEAAPAGVTLALAHSSARAVLCFAASGAPGLVEGGACDSAAFAGATLAVASLDARIDVTVAPESGHVAW